MAITKKDVQEVGAVVEKAVKAALAEAGLGWTLESRRGSYDSGLGTFDIRLGLFKGEDGMSKGQALWEEYAGLFNLPKDGFGKEFTTQGRTFVISGINPKASKMPIEATDKATGKGFKFTEQAIQGYLPVVLTIEDITDDGTCQALNKPDWSDCDRQATKKVTNTVNNNSEKLCQLHFNRRGAK